MTTNLNILIENYHHLIKMKKINMLLIVIFSLIIIIGMVIVSSLYLSNESSQPITGQAILKDDVKVKIGYREHLLYLPAYVAQKNNYYAEEGLEAELINFDSTNQLVEAVAKASQIDTDTIKQVIQQSSVVINQQKEMTRGMAPRVTWTLGRQALLTRRLGRVPQRGDHASCSTRP